MAKSYFKQMAKARRTKMRASKPKPKGLNAMLDTSVDTTGKYIKPSKSPEHYVSMEKAEPSSKQAYKLEKAMQRRLAKSNLSAKQRYKLEKSAIRNEQMKISSRPETIRAVGQAIAMNTAGPAAGIGASASTNVINNLTSGGANVTTPTGVQPESSRDNDEIIYGPGQYEVQ